MALARKGVSRIMKIKLTAVNDKSKSIQKLGGEFIQRTCLSPYLKQELVGADVVVHFPQVAGNFIPENPDKVMIDNVIKWDVGGAREVLNVCSEFGVRCLLISTNSVFPKKPKFGGYREGDLVYARNFFGMTMIGVEQAFRLTYPEDNFKVIRTSDEFDANVFAECMSYFIANWDIMPERLHIDHKNKSWFHSGLNVDMAVSLGFPL